MVVFSCFVVFWGVRFFTLYELLLLVVFVDLFWGSLGVFCVFIFVLVLLMRTWLLFFVVVFSFFRGEG